MSDIKVGDLATADGSGGRVTAIRKDRVEVELNDRPGLCFWFHIKDVRVGTPPPRPVMMASRFAKREKAVEVRAVCQHLNLAELCPDCAMG